VRIVKDSNMTRPPTIVSAVALITIDLAHLLRPEVPRGVNDHLNLAGAAVLAHRVRPNGTLSFSLEACVAPAGISEAVVVDWLEDELTVGGLIAAHRIYDTVLPLIRSLAVPGRHVGLAALGIASASRFHDLTEHRANGEPIPFAAACRRAGLTVIPSNDARQQSWWATGDTASLVTVLAANARAAWQLWLAHHVAATGDAAFGRRATAQFDCWRALQPPLTDHPAGRPLPTLKTVH
jgi:hypothetical protein